MCSAEEGGLAGKRQMLLLLNLLKDETVPRPFLGSPSSSAADSQKLRRVLDALTSAPPQKQLANMTKSANECGG